MFTFCLMSVLLVLGVPFKFLRILFNQNSSARERQVCQSVCQFSYHSWMLHGLHGLYNKHAFFTVLESKNPSPGHPHGRVPDGGSLTDF